MSIELVTQARICGWKINFWLIARSSATMMQMILNCLITAESVVIRTIWLLIHYFYRWFRLINIRLVWYLIRFRIYATHHCNNRILFFLFAFSMCNEWHTKSNQTSDKYRSVDCQTDTNWTISYWCMWLTFQGFIRIGNIKKKNKIHCRWSCTLYVANLLFGYAPSMSSVRAYVLYDESEQKPQKWSNHTYLGGERWYI